MSDMLRKQIFIIIVISMTFLCTKVSFAQSEITKPSVVRIEGAGQFPIPSSDKQTPTTQQIIYTDDFSYYTSAKGMYVYFHKPNNNVRLFALTGQLIWSGELVSGRFFIPLGEGIYILRVNNKSYKISCK